MIQKEIYKQDISRDINGVIKAGSTEKLAEEIKEYVITAEQMQPGMLPALFDTLASPKIKKSVWISGDFGSGKSHLLKILSYVLENSLEIDGVKCGETFADKVEEDFELKANIQKVLRIPTESILFNIQEKYDGIGKNETDPVLNIFLKEFNKKLGYDDKKPAIAEIERYFARQGRLETFKTEFKAINGKDWETLRPAILMQQQKLAKVIAKLENTDEQTALQNIKTQIDNYTLDPDGFIQLIVEYLDKQAPGSRLIFFVDEVGQFIAKDVNRMLSLQTIAEGLADKTGGRTLLMVTSQMDMDATLGNIEKQQEYDFSRIQGRFTIKLNLTSANADEVIQRRLLEKNPEPEQMLVRVYENQRNIIKSLFQFGDESQFKSSYKSAEEFAVDFPFVDYQFDLLQRSIIELSKNNAFTGRQQSVGERSLLTIAQEVAKLYADKSMDEIVQFSDMYEGLRGILQTRITSDIQQAEKTLGDPLALKLLKTLFMLKYVKGFPTTVDNITKIQLPTLDTDFTKFRSEIQQALNILVRQSYIEKGAKDDYHYQTNEEKDIEREIKEEELAPDSLDNELKKIFRDEIYSNGKISLSAQKNFSFGRFVDTQQDGRDNEINLHIVTPMTSLPSGDPEAMEAYSYQHPGHLFVVLDEDRYLSDDLTTFKKAERCLNRLFTQNTDQYRQQIITDKRRVNHRRREAIVERLKNLSKTARLFLDGEEITDIRSTDEKARITEGLRKLVEKSYYRLDMLNVEYDDETLRKIISSVVSGDYFPVEMDEAMTEVFTHIQNYKLRSVRVKVSDIIKDFQKAPYGWYPLATLNILAKLFKMDKISFQCNGSVVEEKDLHRCFVHRDLPEKTIIGIEESISSSQISSLKKQYKELFENENCLAHGAKDVHKAFTDRARKEKQELEELMRVNPYEFVKECREVVEKLGKMSELAYPALFNMKSEIEGLIDAKEDTVDEVRQFIQGPQFKIFTRVAGIKNNIQANLDYVDQTLIETVDDIYTSREPWNKMVNANNTIEEINASIVSRQATERENINSAVDAKIVSLQSLPQIDILDDRQKQYIFTELEAFKKKAGEERFIGNIRAMNLSIDDYYNKTIERINALVEKKEVDERRKAEESEAGSASATSENTGDTDAGGETGTGGSVPKKPASKKMVQRQVAMRIDFGKNVISSKEDVEKYVDALKAQLLKYVDDNTDIILY